MRIAAYVTIAPLASIGILAKRTSGIELIFKLDYKRPALDGAEFAEM